MLESVGLGAIVKFDGTQAVAGMRQMAQHAASLSRDVERMGSRLSSGMMSAGAGLAQTGFALAPFAAAVGLAGDKALSFEERMSFVQSKLGVAKEEMVGLSNAAKTLGMNAEGGPIRAAEAMEILAQQGYNVNQIIEATPGLMNAAAADSIPLAKAADIISASVNAFGLTAADSGRVADVLAKTSAMSASAMIDLGHAMKFVAPVSRTVGVNIAETSAFLGALADNGIKGTLAGTALKNAMLKLAKPSEKAAGWMKANRIEVQKTAEGNLDLVGTMSSISKALQGEKDKMKRVAMLEELFGLRGMPGLTALENSLTAMTTDKDGKEISRFQNMFNELQKEFVVGGAAAEMAATRLDNVRGALKLLGATLDGLSIETMSGFLPGMKETLVEIINFTRDVVKAMMIMNQSVTQSDADFAGLNSTAVSVAKGIADGLKIIGNGFTWIKNQVAAFGALLEQHVGGDGVRQLTKFATLFVFAAAALSPILIGLGAIVMFVGAVLVPVVTIGAEAIISAFGLAASTIAGAGVAIGAVVIVINSMRDHNESFFEAFIRIWNGIVNTVMGVVDMFINEFENVRMNMDYVVTFLGDSWAIFSEKVGGLVRTVVGSIILAFEFLKPAISGVLQFLGDAFEVFGSVAGVVIGGVMRVFGFLADVIGDVVMMMIEGVVNGLLLMAKMIVSAGNALGIDVPTGLVQFAAQDRFQLDSFGAQFAARNFGAKVAEDEPGDIMNDPNFRGSMLSDQAVKTGKAKAAGGKTEVAIDLNDNRTLDVNNCVTLDGRKVAQATAKNQVEVNERRGFKATPWQRRVILEQGAQPVVTGG